ncbi:DUF2953 domain-containing protein [Virgibacillus sp. C22-A2]|uniref:DUF2953 domain-containing protein n=1 Tax=Virgibacillus tibetensis TaxID=3042313 RepID=A0ABU6K9K7_9BACI|nr:DUF2953 domain-containing protein [Virgibacillus sp. C22-A2]
MLWLFLVFLILLFIILFSRVYFTCNFTYTPNERFIGITATVLRIPIFTKRVPINENNTDVTELIGELNYDNLSARIHHSIHMMRKVNSYTNTILKKSQFHKLVWITRGGTGDASTTGIATGGTWTVKYMLIGILKERSNLVCKPVVEVIPHYQNRFFQSNFDCMISIKIGHAIHALIKVIRLYPIKNKAVI